VISTTFIEAAQGRGIISTVEMLLNDIKGVLNSVLPQIQQIAASGLTLSDGRLSCLIRQFAQRLSMVIEVVNPLIEFINWLSDHERKQLLLEMRGLIQELMCKLNAPLLLFGPINLLLIFAVTAQFLFNFG